MYDHLNAEPAKGLALAQVNVRLLVGFTAESSFVCLNAKSRELQMAMLQDALGTFGLQVRPCHSLLCGSMASLVAADAAVSSFPWLLQQECALTVA